MLPASAAPGQAAVGAGSPDIARQAPDHRPTTRRRTRSAGARIADGASLRRRLRETVPAAGPVSRSEPITGMGDPLNGLSDVASDHAVTVGPSAPSSPSHLEGIARPIAQTSDAERRSRRQAQPLATKVGRQANSGHGRFAARDGQMNSSTRPPLVRNFAEPPGPEARDGRPFDDQDRSGPEPDPVARRTDR